MTDGLCWNEVFVNCALRTPWPANSSEISFAPRPANSVPLTIPFWESGEGGKSLSLGNHQYAVFSGMTLFVCLLWHRLGLRPAG